MLMSHFSFATIDNLTEMKRTSNYRCISLSLLFFSLLIIKMLPYRSHPINKVFRDADYNGECGEDAEECENRRGLVDRQWFSD